MKHPLDPTPHSKSPLSVPLHPKLADGRYVYAQAVDGVVHVAPDAPLVHPKVLGGALPAAYAGDTEIEDRVVVELTNCSGTFQFDSIDGLRAVAAEFERVGLQVADDALVIWSHDGSVATDEYRQGAVT